MSNATDQQQPIASTAAPVDEWELTTTITRSPVPIVEACGTDDGCATSCASSCTSS